MEKMMDVSVIIPARNEEYLQKTIDDVLAKSRAKTEVIAILDGYWPEPGIADHPRVKIIHHTAPIGQRAATNEGARLSRAKYIMKLDAHCILDEGFDVKLMEHCEYDWTVLPRMKNVDAFHWVCAKCGKEYNQGPMPISCECNESGFEKKEVWEPRRRRAAEYLWFDTDLRVKYFDNSALKDYGEGAKAKYHHVYRDWAKGKITDVMCGIGACWFLHRERYWDLGGLDEKHGSWGQMAVEIACKAWLSGGRHVINKHTWFAHLFRTQTGFSWPYDNPSSEQERARTYSRNMWLNNRWGKQVRKLDWLIDKFSPLPGWDKRPRCVKKKTKGIVYYTDNQCEERILHAVRNQIDKCCNGHSVIAVSLIPIKWNTNFVLNEQRSYLTMFKQILKGIEESDADIVFLCEHDVLYHPSHFEFEPAKEDVFYYNENVWKVCAKTGRALFYYTKQTSGLCAYRDLLLEHYTKRVERVEKEGFTRRMGFEPGTHSYPRGVDNYKSERWMSEYPNIDIRHSNNLTSNRWRKDQFRSQKNCQGWKEAEEVEGWGRTKGNVDTILKSGERLKG